MAIRRINPADRIEISCINILLFGAPGGGKTSLAQTAEAPITLDVDVGAHRSGFRKDVVQFDNWKDIAEFTNSSEMDKYKTINCDTVGRLLDFMTAHIMATDTKASYQGNLNQPGWGKLKSLFIQWASQMRTKGKDLVLIAHERELRKNDQPYMRPDIVGGSYGEIMKFADLVGFLYFMGDDRIINFSPCDYHTGKNPVQWKPLRIPDFSEQPRYLATLIANAKKILGGLSERSATVGKVVEEWKSRIAKFPTVAEFNSSMAELRAIDQTAKVQIWECLQQEAKARRYEYDKTAKHFIDPVPPAEREEREKSALDAVREATAAVPRPGRQPGDEPDEMQQFNDPDASPF